MYPTLPFRERYFKKLQEQHLIWFSSVQDVRTAEIKKQTALPYKQKEDLKVSDENLK